MQPILALYKAWPRAHPHLGLKPKPNAVQRQKRRNLEGAKEQLRLAVIQRDFAKLNEDASLEKYRLGTETNHQHLGVVYG